MSIKRGGGGIVVSVCRRPSWFMGLDGGRMVSFLGIRPILRCGEWSSLLGGWVGRCVRLYALGVVVGLVVGLVVG